MRNIAIHKKIELEENVTVGYEYDSTHDNKEGLHTFCTGPFHSSSRLSQTMC
jgi:hypothetical protein